MRVILKDGLLVVTALSEEERAELEQWAKRSHNHVFALQHQDAQTFRMTDLGPRADACREPINVTSKASDPQIRLISNFAHTPFFLGEQHYASVEGFWQGLKFAEPADRERLAALWGGHARKSGSAAPRSEVFEFEGKQIRVGTADHRALMWRAVCAKFEQHKEAREALLNTRQRPLTHKTRRDSRTIPGAVMAQMWMQIRARLQKQELALEAR